MPKIILENWIHFLGHNDILSKVLQKPGHLWCTTCIEYVGAMYITPEHLSVSTKSEGFKASSQKQSPLPFQNVDETNGKWN